MTVDVLSFNILLIYLMIVKPVKCYCKVKRIPSWIRPMCMVFLDALLHQLLPNKSIKSIKILFKPIPASFTAIQDNEILKKH